MRLVIQRVLQGSVTVESSTVGAIGPGLLVLVGISRDDSPEQITTMARKLLRIRLWNNGNRTWDLNVTQKEFEILLVSQFTLYAMMKGNKPDYHLAMEPGRAAELFDMFVQEVKNGYDASKIQTGAFGEYMNVHMIGDGPVTISLDSNSK